MSPNIQIFIWKIFITKKKPTEYKKWILAWAGQVRNILSLVKDIY